jgi:sugar lactone lactonase YvrE
MKRALTLCWLLSTLAGCSDGGGPAEEARCDASQPGSICTIAGNGENGYDGDDPVVALDAKMSLPQDMVRASDGTLYVLDWNNHRVRSVSEDGMLRHVVGRGELGGSLDDPANSDLNHPTGVLLSADESKLLVAAWHNSKIRSVDLASGEIHDECGDGKRAYFGDEAEAATASLDLPTSIAFDPEGNLAILDQANQVIRRVDAEGLIHRVVGMCVTDQDVACEGEPVQCPNGSGKFTCGDPMVECAKPCNPSYSPGSDALTLRMAQPFGQSADPGGRMVYDRDGNLYFADTANHLIRRVTVEGELEIVAGVEPVDGEPQSGSSPDGTPATETLLNRPTDLALASDGALYFSDVYNHCVRKVTPEGDVYTVAGQCGKKGFEGDGGLATDALLKLPYGVELSESVLYVADTGNNRIRSVNLEEPRQDM